MFPVKNQNLSHKLVIALYIGTPNQLQKYKTNCLTFQETLRMLLHQIIPFQKESNHNPV